MPGPEESSLLGCRPGTSSGTHNARTTDASPTRRPAAASARVSGPASRPLIRSAVLVCSSAGVSEYAPAPRRVVLSYSDPDRHSETSLPHTRIRSRPSALSMARYPTVPRQNTTAVPRFSCCAFIVIGTVNRTSSGRPASAVDRSRTAIRSVKTAVMPIPLTAIRIRPGSCGAGDAYLLASPIPVPARSHSLLNDLGVGMTSAHEWRTSNTRFRYSSSPATLIARQTATGSVLRRLSAPLPATVMIAPNPTYNQVEPVNRGYRTVEDSATATATVQVILRFAVIAAHLPSRRRASAGRRAGATAARPWPAACSRWPARAASPRRSGSPPSAPSPPAPGPSSTHPP